jgi:hypothetical protein
LRHARSSVFRAHRPLHAIAAGRIMNKTVREASKLGPCVKHSRLTRAWKPGLDRPEPAPGRVLVHGMSLQVTCSRLGISLRKHNGYSMSRPVPLDGSAYAKHVGTASATPPKFEIVLHYRGATQTAILPLTSSDIARLGVEAALVQNSSMLRVISAAVAGAIKRNMIQQILQKMSATAPLPTSPTLLPPTS